MNKFLGNEFSEEHITTIAAEYQNKTVEINNKKVKIAAEHQNKTVEINNKKVKITFWDTAGQEAFRAVAKMFYKGQYLCYSLIHIVIDMNKHLIIYRYLNILYKLKKIL